MPSKSRQYTLKNKYGIIKGRGGGKLKMSRCPNMSYVAVYNGSTSFPIRYGYQKNFIYYN